jgi:hypothetical protein
MNAVLTICRTKDGAPDQLVVRFTDDSGRVVSLAFDKRAIREDSATWGTIAEYGVYNDCPVMLPGGIRAELTDLSIALFELEAQDVRMGGPV